MVVYTHWRGSAQRLPLGEAVATIGSSEPIVVTDEGLPQADYTEMSINSVQGTPSSVFFDLPSLGANRKIHLPPGEGFSSVNNNLGF